MHTRSLFRGLTGQGHVVMDVDYTLWPQAAIPEMVAQAKQAVLWLKEHGDRYNVDPDRIVLMGSSAGGHLALLAAYTTGHPAFPPLAQGGDTTVCGVVAFYPPVDLLELEARAQASYRNQKDRPVVSMLAQGVDAAMGRHFRLHEEDVQRATGGEDIPARRILPAIIGAQAGEVPEIYQLLSPSEHVGPQCPPTMLLLGSDDFFQLAPAVRRLHRNLRRAKVPSVLVEFPHADHAFDLVLPGLSPLAHAANSDVERFLALLAAGTNSSGSPKA
jgi:acetyl esterase/lipase